MSAHSGIVRAVTAGPPRTCTVELPFLLPGQVLRRVDVVAEVGALAAGRRVLVVAADSDARWVVIGTLPG